jgi:hypothetical protein
MSYIGVQATNRLSPSFVKEDFTGDGSATQFTLTNEVPGGNEDNVMVVLSNIIQEPTSAYTIIDDSNNLPKILKFDSAPGNGEKIYLVHHGIGTYTRKPAPGSVGINELETNLKSFTTDTFTGNGSTAAYTMSETPSNANSVLVFVDGILQKSSTNYSISGATLTFTANGYSLDTFSGNGSTTTFTLSTAVGVNDAFVFYNGVCMQPTTDYGISGTTLTFTFTPLNSSNIMVRYQV